MNHLWLRVGLHYTDDFISQIELYFKKVGKSRDLYVVDMKQIIARDLAKELYTRTQIGKILNVDQSTVTHYLNTRHESPLFKEVKKHYKEWIMNVKVPLGKSKEQLGFEYDEKYGKFKLKKI